MLDKIVTLHPKGKKEEPLRICLCGKDSPHAKRKDCVVVHPGTPMWNALQEDVRVNHLIVVERPDGREDCYRLMRIEDVGDAVADAA